MKLTYEEAVLELEKILIELESEDCTLKESIEKFKRGVMLFNHCKDLITKAEGEIKILLEDEDDMKEETFSMEV
ncbi:MAG: exodeoxyribonuclease VII small subunit [Tissierellia bacterium]|nr:exodeoxyribonuclease VII small subunit [Tissierellia bacterium]